MPAKKPKPKRAPVTPPSMTVTAAPDKPKRGRGQPPYQPTEEHKGVAEALSAFGHSQETIAAFIGISVETLVKNYADPMNQAKLRLDAGAITGLAKGLQNGEAWAVIYTLKTRGRRYGWSQGTPGIADLSELLGGVDLGKLSEPNFRQLVSLLELAGLNLTQPSPDTPHGNGAMKVIGSARAAG